MARTIRLIRTSQTRRPNTLVAGLLAIYALQAALAYSWTIGAGGLAVLWVGNGILAAGLLLLQPRQALALALGCALTDFAAAALAGSPPAQALMIAGMDLLEAILAALLIRRVCGAALDMASLIRFRNLALFAVLPATMLIGTLGSTASYLLFDDDPFAHLWNTWAIGDFLGGMIGAPATLMLARFRRHDTPSAAGPAERIGLIAIMAIVTGLIFFQDDLPLLFLVFPFGLILVIRVNPPYAAVAVVAISLTAAAATMLGRGPIASAPMADISERVLLLQLFLATVLFCSLALSSLLAQRSRAQARLVHALAAARASRRNAEEAAGAKARFLAIMSHEMRTPLNGIVGFTQLLDRRTDIPASAQGQIRSMRTSADVLLALISDVLDYSRGEAGGAPLSTAPFVLQDLLARTVEIIRPGIADRPVTLTLDSDLPPDLTVVGDERRLMQIILNLLGNASKFTAQGEVALVARSPWPGTFRISVRDSGMGIPKDKLSLIFQPFTQIDATTTRGFEGAGLGLAISKALVEQMGGRIGAGSVEGQGSEFWFEVPLPAAARPSAAPSAPSAEAEAEACSGRVLVVDDHPINREVACLMLTSAGLTVETVDSGAAAVAAVQGGGFDLVFMDIHMPGMDGLQACREIRALDGEPSRVPVIAMTAAALPEDVDRCLACGMSDHVAKPIRQEELIDKALRHLSPASGSRLQAI